MKKQSIFTVIIIVIILILAIIYTALQSSSNKKANNIENSDTMIEEPLEIIHVKHQYKNGVHIFAGDLIVENDCSNRLESNILEEGPTLIFKTINENPDEPCTEEAFKTYPYKLFHTSDENTNFKAEVNGKPVRLNIYEISPDEDIDVVDSFIKG